jgi:hypothetical protein
MANSYDDIYIRDTFADSGTTPSVGSACQSPDIIPYQDYILNWVDASNNYAGPDIGKVNIQNKNNFIYIRARNLQQVNSASGSASLYYSLASLLILPSDWTRVQTAGGSTSVKFYNRNKSEQAGPNEILLGSEAFLITKLPPVASNDHYCYIAVVTTNKHPTVDIPAQFENNAKFAEWVQNSPAIAWRNISYVANTQIQRVLVYKFGNINPQTADFHLRIQTNSSENFWPGTTIRVQCTDTRYHCDQNCELGDPDEDGEQISGVDCMHVPAEFNSTLTITLTSPNSKPFPPNAKCRFDFNQYPSQHHDSTEFKVMTNHFVSYTNSHHEHIAEVKKFIKVGDCSLHVIGE